MTRLLGAVTVLCCLAPVASATVVRKSPVPLHDMRAVLASRLEPKPREIPPPPEAVVTDDSEVLLNGRKCDLKEVPPTATVEKVFIGPDGKTVTRIEFRSAK